MITGKNYIGNELSSQGFITYKTINPETNSENETIFNEATKEEVDKAMELTTKAFKTYKKTSDLVKADFFRSNCLRNESEQAVTPTAIQHLCYRLVRLGKICALENPCESSMKNSIGEPYER